MLTHFNIELPNSQKESKAPFTFNSTLELDGQIIPQGSFISIKIYVTGAENLPVRLYCIRQNGDVVFCDNRGSLVALWKLRAITESDIKWVTGLLVNESGVIAGSIACTKQVVDLFHSVVNKHASDFYFPPNAFILLPQCHVAMLQGAAKAITVTDLKGIKHTFTGDIALKPLSGPDDDTVIFYSNSSFGLKNTYETVLARQQSNGICFITVNGRTVDCRNRRLIIKAKMTAADASNLRVIREKDCLVLKGVKDA